MAVGSAERIIKAPGQLIASPTGFSGSFPYGGTALGRAMSCRIDIVGEPYFCEYESTGAVGEILAPNHRFAFTCVLRGWDSDAVQLLFPSNQSAGAETQHRVLTEPGSTPGSSILTRGVALAYAPDDVEHVPGLVVYNVIPIWSPGAGVTLNRTTEVLLPITGEAIIGAGGKYFEMGLLPDLSIS